MNTYTFKIGNRVKAYQALNIDKAMNKLVKNNMGSFVYSDISLILNNDDKLPDCELKVVHKGFFSGSELVPVDNTKLDFNDSIS